MKNKILHKVKKELSFLVLCIISAFIGVGIGVIILFFMGVI